MKATRWKGSCQDSNPESSPFLQVVHPGRSYLVPASQLSIRSPDTNSKAVKTVLPPPKYAHASVPVIDLRKRESVHSFVLVTSDFASGSRDQGLGFVIRNKVQSSLLVEVPASIHRNLLPFLGASLPPEGSENPARGAKAASGDAGTVKLRGRVSFACVPLANVTFAPCTIINLEFESSFYLRFSSSMAEGKQRNILSNPGF